jgi:hypothetical protein
MMMMIIIIIMKAFLDLEDSLDLSISVLIYAYYGVHSDDTGQPIVGDDFLPFLSRVSSIALDFWMLPSARWGTCNLRRIPAYLYFLSQDKQKMALRIFLSVYYI